MLKLARFLLFGYTILAVFGLALLHAFQNHYSFLESGRMLLATGFVLTICLSAYASGLPDVPRSWWTAVVSSTTAVVCAAALFSLVQLFVGDQLMPRLVVLGSSLALVPLLASTVAISSGGLARAQRRDRALVVADVDESRELLDELGAAKSLPAQIVEILPIHEALVLDEALLGANAATNRRKVPASATRMHPGVEEVDATIQLDEKPLRPLTRLVGKAQANIVVLSQRAQLQESILSQTADVHAKGVRVRALTTIYEQWLQKVPVSELERLSLFFDIREVHGSRYRRLKRVLDVLTGLLGVPMLILASGFVVVGNAIGNRGPLFYRQERVGKGGQNFTILKFRTMTGELPGSDETCSWTRDHDARITSFGTFLRRSHLDELPQVVNLLKGDISIVGPRPEQPSYVKRLTEVIPFYQYRHLVRPGLTGWAQVNYGYAGSDAGALQKLQYEFYYLRNQSLWLDVRIIARTLRAVASGSGR